MSNKPVNDNLPAAEKLKPRLCPICRKPTTEASKPFCSPRCADVDLNRWLSGVYAIPAKASEDEEE